MDTITKSFADVAGLSSIYFVSHLGVNCIDFMVFFFFFFFFFLAGCGEEHFYNAKHVWLLVCFPGR